MDSTPPYTIQMAASSDLFPPPPPGLNYVAAIIPSLTFLLISTICAAMLVPITIVLFTFSNPTLRRTPLFILNTLSLASGLVLGMLSGYNQVGLLVGVLRLVGRYRGHC